MYDNIVYLDCESYNVLDNQDNEPYQNISNSSDPISPDSMEPNENNAHHNSHYEVNQGATSVYNNLYELLQEWGFNEDIFEFLQSKDVTVLTLKYMKERHLDELFSPELFAIKVIFEHKLFAWQNKQRDECRDDTTEIEDHNKTMSCSCSKSSAFAKEHVHIPKSKSPSSPLSALQTTDSVQIKDIVNNFEQGKLLLETYKNSQQLSPSDRTMLVHKIIQYFIENNFKLTVPKMKNLSEQLIQLFPTENQNTYFIGRGKLPPKGKLWDRYQCRLRNLKKLSSFREKPQLGKELQFGKRRRKVIKKDATANILTEGELASMALTLKHLRQWDEVLLKWKQTVELRRNYIDNNDVNLEAILQEWPLYKFSRAPELVDIDFDHFQTEKERFFQKWDYFLQVATDLFKTRIKDPVARQNLVEFLERKKRLTADTINFQIIHLLHAVLVPLSTVIQNKRKKYTISDSQNSFVLIVHHSGDVEDVLFSKREACLEDGTCLQPLIVVVGDRFKVEEFYVAIDNIKYKFDCFLAALEYCFKLFYVLNLQYPRECILLWMFVQKYLYNISEEMDEVYPALDTFIGDVNSFKIT